MIAYEAGYTLPGGDLPFTHARILHARNWVRPHTITAATEATDYPASRLANTLTYERWRPADNILADFDIGDWTLTGGTDAGDGKTFAVDTALSNHKITLNHTFTAGEVVLGIRVDRKNCQELRIHANDGTATFWRWFDLGAVSYGTNRGTGATTARIEDLGDDIIQCNLVFTASAGAGSFGLYLGDGASAINWTGVDEQIKFKRVTLNPSIGTVDFNSHTAAQADCFCVAAHNIGTGAGSLRFLHDSNEDGTYTEIGEVEITDDSPVMFFFGRITSRRWRVETVDCAMAQIGVAKVGLALQMERRIYGGHAPIVLSRQTKFQENVSETGEVLGRTKQRTALVTSYDWSHVTADWVRTSWAELIRAAEEDAMFVAWRPDAYGEVAFGQVKGAPRADNMGLVDLMQVGFELRGHSHD